MISTDQPTPLLGGLTPQAFMRRYWQRKPLLIRQALPGFRPALNASALRKLAGRDDVESRLIWREDGAWQMESGPFARLPRAKEPGWTLLVQGVDLHDDATAALLRKFRFVPDARLDDAMISIAGDGGGVGPHFDSYDVFLLQAAGRRRWRIGRQRDLDLEPDAPLKILRNFQPEEEFVLEPGDMLYLPPHVAHDGVAQGDGCMTISIGFRSPSRAELARGMLETAADGLACAGGRNWDTLYRDPGQAAVSSAAAIPETLIDAALAALRAVPLDRKLAATFLGSHLSEPKPGVVFDPPLSEPPDLIEEWPESGLLELDRRTRMLYSGKRVFINGESVAPAAGTFLRQLADRRQMRLPARKPGLAEREALQDWLEAGWMHYRPAGSEQPLL